MIPEYESIIGFRLPNEERDLIDDLIRKGKYKSISQVIRVALKEFLKNTA